jgi:hypothetical protein
MLLRNFGDPREVTSLLRRTTFNMAVGNADAHAKNFSVLHEPDSPAVRLAPLHDVLSTISLEPADSDLLGANIAAPVPRPPREPACGTGDPAGDRQDPGKMAQPSRL